MKKVFQRIWRLKFFLQAFYRDDWLNQRQQKVVCLYHQLKHSFFVPFLPRSVGLASVPAPPNGAFVIAPSIDCHSHSNPFSKSYSTRPTSHMLSNKPDSCHSCNRLCTVLVAP